MQSTEITVSNRSAVVNTLAIVGFVALVGAGMWLALYSTRFVPGVVNRVGSAAVYLGSVFTRAPEPSLSVVPTPTASTTISFNESSSTVPRSVTNAPTPKKPATAGTETSGTYQIGDTVATSSVSLSGLPDFITVIDATGYLATTSADSFIQSSSTPYMSRPAVKFTIKNVGTNATGLWRFSASIPTQTSYIYISQPQQSLNPGDSIDYTLGFDQANRGVNQTVSVTANFDHAVAESNPNNNSASASITVMGN
ncbi:hypothetical protein KGQ72_00040 [Patescibacteria group bacterium]|nr:hypothetical protein [Patescibacteria group bacterium]